MVAFEFWKHSKQHSSKTIPRANSFTTSFWKHSKQHSSKTS
ncbi:Iron(III) dicitrate transport system permease protein FecD (TC 3.A.1.14.1) [Vagococcus fluvialis bH819]|uniref:Iron(III) dicitrate transport system permease protein FecD (TC 3.A.1.14.1) n=1 Tax=Vagococcus fluvialis bH819 TaxID=1255619 RepID=A0A1X6WKG6_9ENTE|nr:Iron(III) dicitrate transport system permease protein FecD (TC 3.A.1.14.1) [Vagococcus fluvialis bH819]